MQKQLFVTGSSCGERLGPGTVLLPAYADAATLLPAIREVVLQAPLRHMQTPGGRGIRVAMSNCGAWGWVSSTKGYAYSALDPLIGQPWPALPPALLDLAQAAAAAAGYGGFVPDACLINCYEPGVGMGLHQDRDEHDLAAPVVSVSLGLPALFLWGGLQRNAPVRQLLLQHEDVLVWGGPDRLRFHGIKPLAAGQHPQTGARRFNLTFRRAR